MVRGRAAAKIVEFFAGHPLVEDDPAKALRVSRYLGEDDGAVTCASASGARGTRGAREAAVSLAEDEAERLARFLADSPLVRQPSSCARQQGLTARAWRAAAAGPSRAGRQLDDEGRGARKRWFCQLGAVRVASGWSGTARLRGARTPRVARSAPGAHDGLRLVVPDRHVGPDALHEPPGQPGLPLRPGPRARVLRIPASPIGIHSEPKLRLRSTPRPFRRTPRRLPVRVQVVDDPEVEPGRERPVVQPPGDVDSLALVTVDAADDEDLPRAREVAEAVDADGPAALRVAEHAVPLLRLGRGGEGGGRQVGGEHSIDTVRARLRSGTRPGSSSVVAVVRIALATLLLALVVSAPSAAFVDPERASPSPSEPAKPGARGGWRRSVRG